MNWIDWPELELLRTGGSSSYFRFGTWFLFSTVLCNFLSTCQSCHFTVHLSVVVIVISDSDVSKVYLKVVRFLICLELFKQNIVEYLFFITFFPT